MQPARTRLTARWQEAMGWQPVARPDDAVLFINPRSGGAPRPGCRWTGARVSLGIEPRHLQPGQDLGGLGDEAVIGARMGSAWRRRRLDGGGCRGGVRARPAVRLRTGRDAQPLRARPRRAPPRRRRRPGGVHCRPRALIDIGEVDGVPFLDNVVLGFYGDAVRREGYRDARLRTLLEAARDALGPGAPAAGLWSRTTRAATIATRRSCSSPNNPYAVDRPVAQTTRPRLDGGRLGIVVFDRPGSRRTGHAWVGDRARAVSGPRPVRRARRGGRHPTPPLHFSIRPRALRVRISARHPGASPAAQLSSLIREAAWGRSASDSGPTSSRAALAPGRGGPRPRRGDKVRDGWPDTGDLAFVVGDGYVRWRRPKDLIIPQPQSRPGGHRGRAARAPGRQRRRRRRAPGRACRRGARRLRRARARARGAPAVRVRLGARVAAQLGLELVDFLARMASVRRVPLRAQSRAGRRRTVDPGARRSRKVGDVRSPTPRQCSPRTANDQGGLR